MKNGKTADISQKDKDMVAFSKYYLILYNTAQTAGWSYILFHTLKCIVTFKSAEELWKICGTSLLIFQSLAGLEVIHCILRLVPANPVVTFVQVASRVMQVWGIMLPIERVQTSPTLTLTFLAWSVTEVVRYSFYVAHLVGVTPKFLTWCRYSLFYVLYPCGVTGEVSNIYLALDTIKKRQLYSLPLPNVFNISFSYYYANILILFSYIPLFPQLFLHMVKQRKKVLGGDLKTKVK